MAKTDTLHIRVEPSVKQKAEKTLRELGLSITDAINVFLNQVILQDGIPFEIKKPRFNQTTIEAMEDAKNNRNLSEAFDTVEDLFEELGKEC
jgi:DNA-damage-inducible protein J